MVTRGFERAQVVLDEMTGRNAPHVSDWRGESIIIKCVHISVPVVLRRNMYQTKIMHAQQHRFYKLSSLS